MIPILEILIPTFNRPEDLKATLCDIAQVGDLIRSGRLNITVFDNSDVEQDHYLGANIRNLVNYNFNGANLGYHGNVRKCLSKRSAVFSWLIADDDKLVVSEIPKVVDYLDAHQASIVGLALPYKVRHLSSSENHTDISLKPDFGTIAKFREVVLPDRIPFDFLSSFIIKSSLLDRVSLSKVTSSNDYFHSLIYCSCISPDDSIGIYDAALVTYTSSGGLNWSLSRLVKSKYEICDMLVDKFLIHMNKSSILSEVLKWAIFGRIGNVNIRDLDREISSLVWLALRDRTIKNLLLALLLIIPVFFVREVTIFALALSAGKNTSNRFWMRLRNMRQVVNKK